ncbi:hypothetical protein DPPLL_26970 [Desulfofustis limnaeus]|uniref:Uncharacterized protein n=1 Tax=Desulfofustis limnaeus TaxID=2740163 RepID=A0ABN6MB62_9BACT|nr:hypothetical protein DPPLL_26970 [Desulfofustis limnaeus]
MVVPPGEYETWCFGTDARSESYQKLYLTGDERQMAKWCYSHCLADTASECVPISGRLVREP